MRALRLAWTAASCVLWAFVLTLYILPAHRPVTQPHAAQTTAVQLTAARLTPGNAMLNWAETQTGKPYVWGGTGPYGYDCSGIVYAAAQRIGIDLPRTTYEMVWSWHLVRTWYPVRGDLAFWGPVGAPYHVEFVTTWYHTTFGAQDFGTLVGWHQWGGWWVPSAFYRIVR